VTTSSFDPAATTDLTMFTTTWCGFCRTLKRQLDDADIAFTEIDIEQTPGAAEFVAQVNGGNRTVPTLLFPDGSVLTNPRLSDVREHLNSSVA
jgi:mycoredoxin